MEDPIKKKIQELCPDVMELKFGCEVKVRGLPRTAVVIAEMGNANVRLQYTENGRIENVLFGENSLREKEEILGSPITLAVVLRAMSKVGVMTEGANKLINIADVNAPDIRWNLLNDNYDAQTKETQLFIGSLLGV